jgi:hypothetical protein
MAVLPRFIEGAAFGVFNDILSEFRSNEGYARPNHYEVMIYKPSHLKENSVTNENDNRFDIDGVRDMDKISMRCESVTLPGRTLSTVDDTNIHGPRRQVVDGVMYADSVAMTFQSSADGAERVAFEKWQHRAFNPKTWQVGYYNHYVGTVEIFLLDHLMKRRYGIQLMEAFPKILGDVSLSGGASAEILKWTVDINFRYWRTADINQQKSTLTDKLTQTLTNVAERNLSRALPAVMRLF